MSNAICTQDWESYVEANRDIFAQAEEHARTAGDDSPIARGFIQIGQADWLRLASIDRVSFNTGPGEDICRIWLPDLYVVLEDDDARAFWQVWTAYLREGE